MSDEESSRLYRLVQDAAFHDIRARRWLEGTPMKDLRIYANDILRRPLPLRERQSRRSRGTSASKRWSRSVIARDQRCACGSTERLNAHHIRPWATDPALRYDLNNGITVCVSCHAKLHPHIAFVPRAFHT